MAYAAYVHSAVKAYISVEHQQGAHMTLTCRARGTIVLSRVQLDRWSIQPGLSISTRHFTGSQEGARFCPPKSYLLVFTFSHRYVHAAASACWASMPSRKSVNGRARAPEIQQECTDNSGAKLAQDCHATAQQQPELT